MNYKLQIRELLSWIILVAAILILGTTVTIAQSKTINVNSDNGKVHILITGEDNGKSFHIDTTLESTEDADISQIIEDLEKANGLNENSDFLEKKSAAKKSFGKEKIIVLKNNKPVLADSVMDKMCGEFRKEIQIRGKEVDEKVSMDIKFDLDGLQDMNFEFDFDNFDCEKICMMHCFHSDSHGDNANEKSEIRTDKKGQTIKKIIKSKNGNTIFIYNNVEDDAANTANDESEEFEFKEFLPDLSVFPNPTGGLIKVTFSTAEKRNFNVSVLTDSGKEVFGEKLENYAGNYLREIDLSGKGKGVYVITISSDSKKAVRKIVLN